MIKTAALFVIALVLSVTRLVNAPEPAVGPSPEESQCEAPYRLEHKHSILQGNLERALADAGWQQLVDKGALAVGLVDLTRPGQQYYAGVNDNLMLYAASLPKIAILLSVIEAVDRGALEWTPEVEERLRRMVRISSNEDAAASAALVGLPAIAKTVREPRYCLYDDEGDGGLWMGHAYSRHSPTRRDPLFHITNGATARQAARYYVMLDAGALVSPRWSYRMLDLMGPPGLSHKFAGGMRGRKGVDILARKSGTWGRYHADSALIQHKGWRYVLVGLAETRKGETLMRELVQVVDDLIQRGDHRDPTHNVNISYVDSDDGFVPPT